jgi:hypothetical protein
VIIVLVMALVLSIIYTVQRIWVSFAFLKAGETGHGYIAAFFAALGVLATIAILDGLNWIQPVF